MNYSITIIKTEISQAICIEQNFENPAKDKYYYIDEVSNRLIERFKRRFCLESNGGIVSHRFSSTSSQDHFRANADKCKRLIKFLKLEAC
jgi:hypothetical protein